MMVPWPTCLRYGKFMQASSSNCMHARWPAESADDCAFDKALRLASRLYAVTILLRERAVFRRLYRGLGLFSASFGLGLSWDTSR